MLLKIKVIPKSSQNKVGEEVAGLTKVYVTDPPEKGKANKTVIKLLSEWLGISKSKIKITSGLYSQKKVIEINE